MTDVQKWQLFIDGSWVDGTADETIEVINPATEEPIAEVAQASAVDVDRAINAAARAFDDGRGPWPSMSPAARAEALHRLADTYEKHRDEMVDLIIREVGSMRALAEVGQVDGAIFYLRHWAEQAATFSFFEPFPPVVAPAGMGQSVVVKEPIGVVGAISAFNFPILLGVWKMAPALAMGNTVVLKPSPYTPTSSLFMAQMAAEAGLPDGIFNVVTGDRAAGELLTTHEKVDMVTFTGSDAIGRQVMAQASQGLKRVVLELGGKSANVVFADSDLDDPNLLASLLSFLTNCGQGCILTTRILVERSIHDVVVEKLKAALATVKVGDPAEPDVGMGPLIREAQRQRVERLVANGIAEGASIAFGGGRPLGLDRGFFVEPTLMVDVDNRSEIAQNEVFGPVGVVIPFDDADDAVRLANDSRYGLGGVVWSKDSRRAFDVANRLRVGYVQVNGGDGTILGPIGAAPFGGYKHSGIGRENGRVGAEEFLEFKTLAYPVG